LQNLRVFACNLILCWFVSKELLATVSTVDHCPPSGIIRNRLCSFELN
jgi:hypothetical protein